jgi:Family of unknown function (DUF6510)
MRDAEHEEDPADWLRLDGNAVAGALMEWFGVDMTDAPGACNHCGNVAAVATLHAYTHGPGVVLRCAACQEIVLRFVQTPRGSMLDARGTAWLARPPIRS